MMKIINKEFLKPCKWQDFCMARITKYNVIVAPRQHGKTHMMVEIVKLVAYNLGLRNPVINLCSDHASRIYKLYSGHLVKAFGHHKDFRYSNEKTTSMKFKRKDGDMITINVFGSEKNPKGPKGTAAHLNIVDESGLVPYKFIMEGAMPATDKTGGITIVTGTVEPNQYMDIYNHAKKKQLEGSKHWFTFIMQFRDEWSKDFHTEEALQEIEARYDFEDPKQKLTFEKEYMCNWMAGMEGTPYASYLYAAQQNGQIGDFSVDPHLPVGTSWDDGRGTTAVWFWQYQGDRFVFIDYKEWKEGSLPSICDDIQTWYKKHNKRMGHHVFPHTMAEKSYQKRSQISRRRQVQKHFKNKGLYIAMTRVQNVETKLQAGKQFFARCFFNQNSTFRGIQCLNMYSRTVNKSSGSPTAKIKDNEYAHGGDAFGELALAFYQGRFGMELHNQQSLIIYNKGCTFPY